MTEEETRNDPAFLQLAADVITAAQDTGDDRILAVASAVTQQVIHSNMLPTLLLQYGALLEREKQLLAEIEEEQDVVPMARRTAG